MTFVGFLQFVSFGGQVVSAVITPAFLFYGVLALRKYVKG